MSDLLANLSGVQRDAVTSCETDLIVAAGAGAGKTRVLVSRYLHFHLDKGYDLSEILAITFTEKAAAEMQDRVRAKLIELGRNPEALDNAYISTFHSFCLRILREFPALCGLDPEFGVLDELRARVLLYQATKQEITAGLAVSPPDADLALLVAGLAGGVPSRLIPVLIKAYGVWRESGLPLDEVIAKSCAWDSAQISEALEQLNAKVAELASKREAVHQKTRVKLDELLQQWDSVQGNLLEMAAVWADYTSSSQAIATEVEAVRTAARRLSALEASRIAEPMAKALGSYLSRIHTAYTALKKAENALDFTDLMLKARELFAHPAVSTALRQRFKAILVDEYQDTNGVQKELIDLIRAPKTLFVVGDPKQSIYRFRGAEVEVFAETAAEIEANGGRVIQLAENYRSRAELIDFQNAFFDRLFLVNAPGAISYHKISAKRPNSGVPRVELLTGVREKSQVEENRELEARAIAQRIKELVESGERVGWAKDDQTGAEYPRPISYGDIAILFRSRSDISLYYEALLKAGIPTLNLAGSDFFLRREVADILACLRAIADPQDELALAVALRSPMFGLSDPELWQLKAEYGSFSRAVNPEAPTDRSVPPGLGELRKLIAELHPLTQRIGPTFFVTKILAATGYAQVVLADDHGEQAYANLRKFEELVAALEQAGLTDLAVFLDYLAEITRTSGREDEAQLTTEGEDAVRLLTIHAAKGLEFPVVFVVDGCRGLGEPGFSPPVRFHKEFGFGFRLMIGEKTYTTAQYEQIKDWDSRADYEEAKRIFYVAVTRARDYLVLSGIAKEDCTDKRASVQEAKNWLEWVRLIAADFPTVWQRNIIEYLNERGSTEPEQRTITETAVTGGDSAAAPVSKSLTVAWARERLSVGVSDLLLLNACPRRFYYRRILALPERPLLGAQPRTGQTGGVDPILRGNLAHLVCAQLTPGANLEMLLAAAATELGIPPAEQQAIIAEVRPLIEAYQRSELFARLRASVRTASEEPFLLDLCGLDIAGTFDKLAFFPDGSGLLVDYKTNRVSPAEVAAETAYYRLQLQLYALAVREKYGLAELEAGLYYLVPGVYVPIEAAGRAELCEQIDPLRQYLIPGEIENYPRNTANCSNCAFTKYCFGAGRPRTNI